jgi:lactate dehydrogenase-like 2-hydroxyacid dehydrogenase
MSSNQERFTVAVLDDYQNVALSLADWSVLDARATVTVFNDHLADADAVVERLKLFDVVCVMRERTPMTRSIIERLPKLRLIASTATRNASIDLKAAEERGVQVVHTGYTSAPNRTDLGPYSGERPQCRRREYVGARRRMAAVGR